MTKNNTHQPHDKLFRVVMSEPEVAKDFLNHHLSPTLVKAIDFSTLKLEKETFIDEDFSKAESDVLFSVKIGKHLGYLYILCEQQTKPDKWMPFRLLIYIILIMKFYFKQSGGEILPLVYPIVYYSGRSKWNCSTDIKDLINAPRDLVEQVWMQPFRLEQAVDIQPQEIAKHPFSGTLSWVMANIKLRNFIQQLERALLPHLQKIAQFHDIQFMKDIFWYIINISDINESQYRDFIEKNFTPEVGLEMGLLAEQLMQKGEQKGIQKERTKTAQKLLAEGCDPEFVAKITGLSMAEVVKLKRKISEKLGDPV